MLSRVSFGLRLQVSKRHKMRRYSTSSACRVWLPESGCLCRAAEAIFRARMARTAHVGHILCNTPAHGA